MLNKTPEEQPNPTDEPKDPSGNAVTVYHPHGLNGATPPVPETIEDLTPTHTMTGSLSYDAAITSRMTDEEREAQDRAFNEALGLEDGTRVLTESITASIERYRQRPEAIAALDIAKTRASQQIVLAQRLQDAIGNDAIVSLLVHDSFQRTATAAIDGLNVIRAAVMDLGAQISGQKFAEGEGMSLQECLRVLRYAAAHLAVAKSREVQGERVLTDLRDALHATRLNMLESAAAARRREEDMARALARQANVPRDMLKRWFVTNVTNGQRLCSKAAGKKSKHRLSELYWSADTYRGAFVFTSLQKAEDFVDEIALRIARAPFTEAPADKVEIAGVGLSDIGFSRMGIVDV